MAQRATAGEASIFKDEFGRWHGWITVGLKTNGQRDRRHRSGKTRKEVIEKIRDLEIKRETGPPLYRPRICWGIRVYRDILGAVERR